MRVTAHTVCVATDNPREEKDTRKARRVVISLLAATITVSLLANCSSKKDTGVLDGTQKLGDSQAGNTSGSLIYASDEFDGKFSPFLHEIVPNLDMVMQCTASLLITDRNGSVVLKDTEDETREYNGKQYTYHSISDCTVAENSDDIVYCDFKLKDGVKFSDDGPLTTDDVVFPMYVYSDPTYDGSTAFFALPIQGMEEYRTGVGTLFNLMVKADKSNAGFSKRAEGQQKKFWEFYRRATEAFMKKIVDSCIANGSNKGGDSIAAVAASYGYPNLKTDAAVMGFFNAMLAKCDDSARDMSDKENVGTPLSESMDNYQDLAIGVETGISTPSISGIQKTGDNMSRIVTTKVDAQTIYQIGITVSPLHYYGDKAQYDYINNKSGFPEGDLSLVRLKTSEPLGANPYVFDEYENGVVSPKANPYYDQGGLETKNPRISYINQSDYINSILAGMADAADPSYMNEVADTIKKTNSNGGVSGDKAYTVAVGALGYGYIGMNSHNISVSREPGSDASKNLRRGFATTFAAYRDLAVSTYYDDGTSVINYPVFNTPWAAPQPVDDDYQIIFSKDVNGNPVHTPGMSDEDKYAAAKKAALDFLEAAGYKVENGKIVPALEGAKMEYTVVVPGSGMGDHPSFMIVTEAQKTLVDLFPMHTSEPTRLLI